jgi:hypothetical protein
VPLLVYELYTQGQTARAAALFVIVLGALLIGLVVMGGLSALLRRRFNAAPDGPGGTLPDDPGNAPVPQVADQPEPEPVGSR